VRRVVAAEDPPAARAPAKVHPPAVDLEAVLASRDLLRDVRELDRVEMTAGRRHVASEATPITLAARALRVRRTTARRLCARARAARDRVRSDRGARKHR